jgi:hypothetical protein
MSLPLFQKELGLLEINRGMPWARVPRGGRRQRHRLQLFLNEQYAVAVGIANERAL